MNVLLNAIVLTNGSMLALRAAGALAKLVRRRMMISRW